MSCLIFRDRVFRPFPLQTYRWFRVLVFDISRLACSDYDVIESLIDDDSYVGDYVSPDDTVSTSAVHGPYLLDRLTGKSFLQTTAPHAISVIEDFVDAGVPSVTLQDLDLESLLMEPLKGAAAVYQLSELLDARHELGWMLGDFSEFVAIHREQQQVVCIIMAYD